MPSTYVATFQLVDLDPEIVRSALVDLANGLGIKVQPARLRGVQWPSDEDMCLISATFATDSPDKVSSLAVTLKGLESTFPGLRLVRFRGPPPNESPNTEVDRVPVLTVANNQRFYDPIPTNL